MPPVSAPTKGARTSSSQSSSADSESSADTEGVNSTVSAKFRRRMQPSSEPVLQRAACPCCERNFKQASEKLTAFREHLRLAKNKLVANENSNKPAVDSILDGMSQMESKILLGDEFLLRLLARCNCEFVRALERLAVARTVHKKYTLDTSVFCKECAENPGYHSFRQVGFDRLGRPVLYTCLNQDIETGTLPEQVRDYLLHMIFTVREAEKTIPENQHSLVLVFDTTGLGMSHIRSETVSQFGEILRYFPARMSYALALNLNRVTRFLLKPIIHLTGHQEDVVLLSNGNLERQLSECFDPPLAQWMVREAERNLTPRMPFWMTPDGSQLHDSRGESAYVENFVKRRHPSGHRPHPSIDAQRGASS